MSINKNIARLRRAKSTRAHIRVLGVPRLSVLRTGQHLYAQVFTADGSKVLAAANTTQADVKEGLKNGKNSDAAAKVGKLVAERAKAAGIEKVAFDRSGYRYHGRIKALACLHLPAGAGCAGRRPSSAGTNDSPHHFTAISGLEPYILNQSRNQHGRRTSAAGSRSRP